MPPPPQPVILHRSILRILGGWTLVAAIWSGVAVAAVLTYYAYDLPISGRWRRPSGGLP